MKKFLLNIFKVTSLTVLLFVILRISLPQKKNYISAFIPKLKLLLKYKKTRKIVLFGGSGIGWGISAEQIEKSTGIKTINIGHHAGFGLVDFQQFVMNNISDGDIIVFSPEWTFFTDPSFKDTATYDNLLSNLEYGLIINKPQLLLNGIFDPIRIGVDVNKKDRNQPYYFNCLNKNGDIISQCGLHGQGPIDYKLNLANWNLNRFITTFPFLTRKKTILLFPPTQIRVYIRYKMQLDNIESSIRNGNLKVVNDVSSNVYNDSCFFDEKFHITCENRIIRTDLLISFLKKNLLR